MDCTDSHLVYRFTIWYSYADGLLVCLCTAEICSHLFLSLGVHVTWAVSVMVVSDAETVTSILEFLRGILGGVT